MAGRKRQIINFHKNRVTIWSGLLVIKNKKVLMVREADKDFYMLPGGRVNKGENKEQALEREIYEELGVRITKYQFFKKFILPAKEENRYIEFNVYSASKLSGIKARGDIAEICWIDSADSENGKRIGSITSLKLFPLLKAQKLIN